MTWARLADTLYEDDRVICLSPEAFKLYVTALSFSARNRTDGCITHEELRVVLCRLYLLDPEAIEDLVDAEFLAVVHPRTDDSCAVYKLVGIRS